MKWASAAIVGVSVLIGLTVFALTAACDLPPTTDATVDHRLVVTTYWTPGTTPNVWFMRDRVTNECWLIVNGAGTAVAKADGAACSNGEVPK